MNNFYDRYSQHLHPIFADILETPYVSSLIQGHLPQATYLRFLRLDLMFLTEYVKLLDKQIHQAKEPLKSTLSACFYGALREKFRLRQQCQDLTDKISFTQPWLDYIHFMQGHSNNAQPGLFLASIISCTILYNMIAGAILEKHDASHPYLDWAKATYSATRHTKVTRYLQLMRQDNISEDMILATSESAAQHERQLFESVSMESSPDNAFHHYNDVKYSMM